MLKIYSGKALEVDYLKMFSCCYLFQSEVWICMELMSTCLDKLLKKTRRPIPEKILGKMAVAVSVSVSLLINLFHF